MQQAPTQLSWRDGIYVTQTTAAEIIGYSVASVRRLIFCDVLKAVRLARGGPMLVTVDSLVRFAGEAEPVSRSELDRMNRHAPVKLRLVVNKN